jgi:hypothetical protein
VAEIESVLFYEHYGSKLKYYIVLSPAEAGWYLLWTATPGLRRGLHILPRYARSRLSLLLEGMNLSYQLLLLSMNLIPASASSHDSLT